MLACKALFECLRNAVLGARGNVVVIKARHVGRFLEGRGGQRALVQDVVKLLHDLAAVGCVVEVRKGRFMVTRDSPLWRAAAEGDLEGFCRTVELKQNCRIRWIEL